MACHCERCPECNGSGTVWYSFGGEYLGSHRLDDLDQMEPCEDCRGSGIAKVCWECAEEMQKLYEDEDED
jgi:RecJ-like exonuclease